MRIGAKLDDFPTHFHSQLCFSNKDAAGWLRDPHTRFSQGAPWVVVKKGHEQDRKNAGPRYQSLQDHQSFKMRRPLELGRRCAQDLDQGLL